MGSVIEYIANCSCIPNRPKYPTPYSFHFNGGSPAPQNTQLFESNHIRTTKYTILTFLPKALLLQFKRLANVYFLIIAILLSIDVIAPINAFSAWAPLIIVIGISMIREAYQDIQRSISDDKYNHQMKTRVVRGGKEEEVEWSQVVVGDVCRIQREELFPADLVFLASSNPGNVCYIETASLDGQKNLKPRNGYSQTSHCNCAENVASFSGHFQGDPPNKDLHKFEAKLSTSSDTVILISGDKQLLYRGTRLKNTRWVYGLVIYTGKNTKIMLNSQSESVKMSQVEVKVNYILGIVLAFQALLCLISAIGYGVTRNNNQQSDTYIDWPGWSVPLDGFIIFWTYLVLLNTMIPISLVVSMEMVKLFQKYFIEKDKFMYSSYRKQYVAVQSASLNQELGQIQYVFTDKTGTLTMNIMEFKIAVIGSHLFGDLSLVSQQPTPTVKMPKGFRDQGLKKILQNGAGDSPLYHSIRVTNREGSDQIEFTRKRQLAQEYFLLLGLAHQVVAEKNKDGSISYQGPSPDEIALVEAAKTMQYEFVSSSQAESVIRVRGREKRFQVLQMFPFTSDRKRMSIVIRDHRDNRIKMMTKGADSIIKGRLSSEQKLNLDHELEEFSKIGLRTLLVGMRLVSEREYSEFVQNLQAIPQAEREKKKLELIDELQRDLYLIGATAVLDRLQDDVPETIRDLIRANIKVWMLTGDKMETAENIAKSCRLIQPHFNVMKFHMEDELSTDRENSQKEMSIRANKSLKGLVEEASLYDKDNTSKALLIEGSHLTHILNSQDNRKLLAELAKSCEAVVCCRLLPIQKAEVVSLVRQQLKKITLAIGDGANDVPMIKTAHIGVGLFGEEGMGAVQASDYALPQFRMLWRLLFVHGRWNYIRISQMILYFFYKNMLFTLPQFIAGFFNGFSGQTIFNEIYITLYNLMFTALPLVIRAVLEQDVNYVYQRVDNDEEMEPQLTGRSLVQQKAYLPEGFGVNKYFYRLFPKIYFIGQENCIFNYSNYFMWMLEGILEAILITLFCFYIFGQPSLRQSGISPSWRLTGLTIYAAIVLVVTFKLATHTRFWSCCYLFSILITSLGFFAAYTWISSYALSPPIEGTAEIGWTTGETYLVVLFCIVMVLALDGAIVYIDFRSSQASKMREVVRQEQINNRHYYDQVSLYITEGLTEQAK